MKQLYAVAAVIHTSTPQVYLKFITKYTHSPVILNEFVEWEPGKEAAYFDKKTALSAARWLVVNGYMPLIILATTNLYNPKAD